MVLLFELSESRVLINFDHFTDNLVLRSIHEGVSILVVHAGVVSALVEDPLLLLGSNLLLEVVIVLADYLLDGVVVAIANVVRSLRNSLLSLNVIGNKSESIGSESLEDLSVELSVFIGVVGPLLFLEFEVVVEEVLAFDQLPTVPFCNVTALKTT